MEAYLVYGGIRAGYAIRQRVDRVVRAEAREVLGVSAELARRPRDDQRPHLEPGRAEFDHEPRLHHGLDHGPLCAESIAIC